MAAALVTRLGCARVSVLGSLAAAAGLVAASLARGSLAALVAGLSVVAGAGFGLMYMAAMVAVSNTFSADWRPLALGEENNQMICAKL